jgi:hypothetical protein
MNKRYNRISLAWGISGILLQVVGLGIEQPLVTLLGTVLLVVGLAYYAKAKGRSAAWCLMGFLSIIGLIVLVCLKDRSKEGESADARPVPPGGSSGTA